MARHKLKGVLKKKKKWKKSKREKGYSYLQTGSGVYGQGARMRDVVSQLQIGKKPNRPPKNPSNYVPHPAVRPDRDDLWNYPDRENMLSTYPDREGHLQTYPDRESAFALPDRDNLSTFPDREGHLLTYHDRFEPDEDRDDNHKRDEHPIATQIHRIAMGLRVKRLLVTLLMPEEEQFNLARTPYSELLNRFSMKVVEFHTAISDLLSVPFEQLISIQNGMINDLRGYYAQYMDRGAFSARLQTFLDEIQSSILRATQSHDYSELEMSEFHDLGSSIEESTNGIIEDAKNMVKDNVTKPFTSVPKGYQAVPQKYDTSYDTSHIEQEPPREDVTYEDPMSDVTGEYMGEMESLGKQIALPNSSASQLVPKAKPSIDLVNSTPIKLKDKNFFKDVDKYSFEIQNTSVTSPKHEKAVLKLVERIKLPMPNVSPIKPIAKPGSIASPKIERPLQALQSAMSNKSEFVTPPSITKPGISLPQYAKPGEPLMTPAQLQDILFRGKGRMTAQQFPKLVTNFNDYLNRLCDAVNAGDHKAFHEQIEKLTEVAARIPANEKAMLTGNSPMRISRGLSGYPKTAAERFPESYFKQKEPVQPKYESTKPEPKPLENSELDPIDDPIYEPNIYNEMSEVPSEYSTIIDTGLPKSASMFEVIRDSEFVVALAQLTLEDVLGMAVGLATGAAEAWFIGFIFDKLVDLAVYLGKTKKLKLIVPQSNVTQGQSDPNTPLITWKVVQVKNPFYDYVQTHAPEKLPNHKPELGFMSYLFDTIDYLIGARPSKPIWEIWEDDPLIDPNYKKEQQAAVTDMVNKLLSPPDKPTNNSFQQLQIGIHDSKSNRIHIANMEVDRHAPPSDSELIQHLTRTAPYMRSIPYQLTSAHMSLVNRPSELD